MSIENPTDVERQLARALLLAAHRARVNEPWWQNNTDLKLARDVLGIPANSTESDYEHLWLEPDVFKVAAYASKNLPGDAWRARYTLQVNGIIGNRCTATVTSDEGLTAEDQNGEEITDPDILGRIQEAIDVYESGDDHDNPFAAWADI